MKPEEVVKAARIVMSKWDQDLARVSSWNAIAARLHEEPATSEEEAERKRAVDQNREMLSAIDAELQDAGVPFRVAELLAVKTNYAEALPILRRHLSTDLPTDVQETLVRAMTVPYGTADDLDPLLHYLPEALPLHDDSLLFATGNAIATIAKRKDADHLLSIVADPSNGSARFQPLLQLGAWKDARIEPIVKRMLETHDNPWCAVRAARRAGLSTLSGSIIPYLRTSDSEVRAEAKLFLKRFPSPK